MHAHWTRRGEYGVAARKVVGCVRDDDERTIVVGHTSALTMVHAALGGKEKRAPTVTSSFCSSMGILDDAWFMAIIEYGTPMEEKDLFSTPVTLTPPLTTSRGISARNT